MNHILFIRYRVELAVKNYSTMHIIGIDDFNPISFNTKKEAKIWISSEGKYEYTIKKIYSNK